MILKDTMKKNNLSISIKPKWFVTVFCKNRTLKLGKLYFLAALNSLPFFHFGKEFSLASLKPT